MSAVKAVRVSRVYPGGGEPVRAVDQVSLSVAAGELAILVGASGSGKSTLLNLIGGLDRPDSGKLTVLGTDMSASSEKELARMRLTRIGFVFQDFNLLRDLTLLENVALPLEGAGVARRTARDAAAKALARVGLSDLDDRFPSEVSGGQQQRVAIARAVVGDREIILADEPTGALDSTTGHEIMKLLSGLSKEGTTVVLSTHNPANLPFASQVVTLRDGRRVETDSDAPLDTEAARA
ncbi:ABC transporter ATP-binding protein [Kitasatospora phosalacinea]|uniref:Macrolide ABC transporter ATP-binding protein n=1 Tax=Kitasatospora phosalacinea TaxID=2065 RepID=A0A9W6PQ55_9ACTN|nr:ABC transporter ATP-binding protein [Kitasatospora phosalacinea]GLW58878.1 macrolide ABC transporter ATP-binding protein [Kitasatospora phosalacinea]